MVAAAGAARRSGSYREPVTPPQHGDEHPHDRHHDDHHDHRHDDGHGRHGHHHVEFDTPEMAAFVTAEGEVLAGITAAAIARLAATCTDRGVSVRRVLDLGCGPGVATCMLAEHFPDAAVVGVDGSEVMLAAATARAAGRGLSASVTTRRATFPDDLPTLGLADVVWASLVLHHVGDEVAALRQVRALLGAGGVLAVVERDEPMRVHVPGVEPAVWERLDAAWARWFAGMRAELPGSRPSDPYPAMLAAAGFEVVANDVLTVELDAPLDGPARQLAQRHVDRTVEGQRDRAAAADIAAIESLTGDGILRRDDVGLRVSRHLYVAVA